MQLGISQLLNMSGCRLFSLDYNMMGSEHKVNSLELDVISTRTELSYYRESSRKRNKLYLLPFLHIIESPLSSS